MSDYNDGKWHAWNGGECPVHPLSEVEYLWHDANRGTSGLGGPRVARQNVTPRIAWSHVFRFRVVKEHKEPREFWLVAERFDTKPDVWKEKPDATHWRGAKIIHVREVLDNE